MTRREELVIRRDAPTPGCVARRYIIGMRALGLPGGRLDARNATTIHPDES